MGQEIEIQYRDQVAATYETGWYTERMGCWAEWLEKRVILNRVNPQQDDVILDAGCGTGRLTRPLARACKKVYAMDFSPRSIEVLNEKARQEGIHNIESLAWDVTQPFPLSERVDKVVSCQVLQHVPSEGGRQHALNNMHDQLCDNGRLILSVYNWRSLFTRGYVKDGYGPEGYYVHRFTPAEVIAALQRCGFTHISVRGYANFGVYLRLQDRYPHLQQLIARSDELFSRCDISRYRGFWLICTAKK